MHNLCVTGASDAPDSLLNASSRRAFLDLFKDTQNLFGLKGKGKLFRNKCIFPFEVLRNYVIQIEIIRTHGALSKCL